MTARRTPSLRRWVYDILEAGHSETWQARTFDIAMTALITANLLAVALESVPFIAVEHHEALAIFAAASVAIFTVEYGLRLWVSVEHPMVRQFGPVAGRLRFALRPIMLVDLLAFAPFYLAPFLGVDTRVLRLFRIFRFLRLAQTSPALTTLARVVYNERRALAGTVVMIFGLAFLCATAMYLIEGDEQPDRFGTIPLSMWWAMTTLTTVGYGDAVPITAAGRILASMVMVLGLGMFALPVGILSSGYVEEIRRRDFVVTWAMVARVPLFSRLDAAGVGEIIRILRAKTVRRGEIIAARGERADAMYFVSSGQIELILPSEKITLGDGDFFGELSLLQHVRRVGTARAMARTDLLVLDADDFERLLDRSPSLRTRITETADDLFGERVVGDVEGADGAASH
jgi:voltage-gated potassium channel